MHPWTLTTYLKWYHISSKYSLVLPLSPLLSTCTHVVFTGVQSAGYLMRLCYSSTNPDSEADSLTMRTSTDWTSSVLAQEDVFQQHTGNLLVYWKDELRSDKITTFVVVFSASFESI